MGLGRGGWLLGGGGFWLIFIDMGVCGGGGVGGVHSIKVSYFHIYHCIH